MLKTIFLLYHDIDSKAEPCLIGDKARLNTVVDISEFESHMEYLKNHGYDVVSFLGYKKKISKKNLQLKSIVLTFDDGHISNYTMAYPLLKKFGFTASFYVITDKIGQPNYLSKQQIKEMHESGMEIGSHTHTHRYLSTLSNEEKLKELKESKHTLEQIIQQEVQTIAYPGGHFDHETIECCQEAGFHSALSCKVGKNSANENPFIYRRIEIRRHTSTNQFIKALTTKVIFFHQLVELLKMIVRKTFGLTIYRNLRRYLYFLYPFSR
jgi:peptidoglycan/xylan/chitin deacetylase (PgdA/CDA1 family)